MKLFSKLTGALLGATILCSAAVTAAQAETVKITFLGVGDVYNFDGGKTRGGLARMNALPRLKRPRTPTRSTSSTATCSRPRFSPASTRART